MNRDPRLESGLGRAPGLRPPFYKLSPDINQDNYRNTEVELTTYIHFADVGGVLLVPWGVSRVGAREWEAHRQFSIVLISLLVGPSASEKFNFFGRSFPVKDSSSQIILADQLSREILVFLTPRGPATSF